MGIKVQRLLHKEQFKSEILAAARELFSQDGYSNFSMRKLAVKIGYSPTTIYLYFRDKDDLLFCICEELYALFLHRMVEIRASRPDLLEALRHSLHSYIDVGLANPERYKAVFFTSPVVYGSPQDFMQRETMALRSYRVLVELIDECMKNGLLRAMDSNTLAQVFWSAVHGLVTSIIFTKDFPLADTAVMAETLVDGLLRGHSV